MAKTTPVRVKVLDAKAVKLLRKEFDERREHEARGTVARVSSVLWQLLRDHVPFGTLEKIVQDLEKNPPPFKYGDDTSAIADRLATSLAQRILCSGREDDGFDAYWLYIE